MNRFSELMLKMAQAEPDWDQAAENRLYATAESLGMGKWDLVETLGAVIQAAPAIQANDWEKFLKFLLNVPGNCKFYGFKPGIAKALELFCTICLVDPKLVEAYLQTSFEEIAARYE